MDSDLIKKKICLIGAYGVGKTSLVSQFVHSMFREKYITTLGVKIDKKLVDIPGRRVMLMIWDTAGEDRFEELNEAHLMGASGYLLVIEGTRRATLEHGLELRQRIMEFAPGVPFQVSVNKVDLRREWDLSNADYEEFAALGIEWRRTSAKTGDGVEAAFQEIAIRSLEFDSASQNPLRSDIAPVSAPHLRLFDPARWENGTVGRMMRGLLNLPRKRRSKRLLADVLSAQQVLVMEHGRDNRYRFAAEPPSWFGMSDARVPRIHDRVDPVDCFEALQTFLPAAERMWRQTENEELESDFWGHALSAGDTLQLVATAVKVGRRNLLIIRPIDRSFRRMQSTLQHFRDVNLVQEKLEREICKKEVLVNCLVHDLSNPVAGVKTLLEFLQHDPKVPDDTKLALKSSQASFNYLENLIHRILEVYAIEIEDLEHYETEPDKAPDLLASCRTEMERLAFSFQSKEIMVALTSPPGVKRIQVVGEDVRLSRIWANLLDNALRFSPRQSRIQLGIDIRGDRVRAEVRDEGPGVSPEVAECMFELMGKDSRSGQSGLGLYFVRMTVERWGGQVGCDPDSQKGACVWFELPRVEDRSKG
ncbi:MAG: ATP-binding protein [Limisphaerales bacterium]